MSTSFVVAPSQISFCTLLDYNKKEINTHNTSICDILKNKPKLNLNVCVCIILFAKKKEL